LDLRRYLGLPAEAIDVFPLGPGQLPQTAVVQESEIRARYGLGSRPFALSVSSSWPHKNLAGLIDALALLPRAERPLVVVPGRTTRFGPELQRRAVERNVADEYRPIGWVSPAELEALYAAAACVVFPSLYEGFGLPVLEAMRRGVPVVCSNAGALTEVAGSAALLFDPRSPSEIAVAIRRVLRDPDEACRLRAAGIERAALFTWEETARRTLASYAPTLGMASIEGGAASDPSAPFQSGAVAP
jgi:glycosyltransferase involved in cell wall biosynthesis